MTDSLRTLRLATVALLLVLAALAWGVAVEHWPEHQVVPWRETLDQLDALIRMHPILAPIIVFVIHALLAATALPGASVLMLAAGAGFGAIWGTLICLAGCTIGATVSMLTARYWLRPWVERRYGAFLAGFERRMAEDGVRYLFSLRLLPVLPFVLVNLAAGLTRMNAWVFTWVSFVGMAAGTYVYAYAGAQLGQVRDMSGLHSPQLVATLAVLALLPWLLRHAARRFGTRLTSHRA